MSRSTVHTLIGTLLFVTGLVALYEVSSPDSAEATGGPLQASAITADDRGRIDGVGPAVEHVLSTAGKIGTLGTDEMSQIPPAVAQALVENGVALSVPSRGED